MRMSESPRQEADVSTDALDKEIAVCPTCGRDDFVSEQYMKVHHKQAHGESIAGREVECDYCGNITRKIPSKINDTHNFCDETCHGKWRSENLYGEDHPLYIEDKPLVECEQCGEEYEVTPAVEDESRFCSLSCKYEWTSENWSGKDHPSWSGGKLELECIICGETVKRKPSHYEDGDNVFCSQSCHRKYQSRHQVGENHHNYSGGRVKEYGENWYRQRRKAIERDGGQCQLCGVHRDELPQDISVHHITPREEFITGGEIDAENANALDNLICLCEPCHRSVESWGVRLDVP